MNGVREFLVMYHDIQHALFDEGKPAAALTAWVQDDAAGLAPSTPLYEAIAAFRTRGTELLRGFVSAAASASIEPYKLAALEAHLSALDESLNQALYSPRSRDPDAGQSIVESLLAVAGACKSVYGDVVARSPCRVEDEVAAAIRAKEPALSRGGVSLRMTLEPEHPSPVFFDPIELRAVVGDLIDLVAEADDEDPHAVIDVVVRDFGFRVILYIARGDSTQKELSGPDLIWFGNDLLSVDPRLYQAFWTSHFWLARLHGDGRAFRVVFHPELSGTRRSRELP